MESEIPAHLSMQEAYNYFVEHKTLFKLHNVTYLKKLFYNNIPNKKDLDNITTTEELYLYLNLCKPHLCDVCGKPTQFKSFSSNYGWHYNLAYRQFCCMECRHKWWANQLHVNNTYNRATPETKEHARLLQSKLIKERIAKGLWTPDATNSWCHSKLIIQYYYQNKLIKLKMRSSWEAMFILLNPHLSYETLRIRYFSHKYNKERIYIVDFIDDENKIVYEIKPQSKLHDIENEDKAKALQQWCELNNYIMKYITEKDLLTYEFKTSLMKHLDNENFAKLKKYISRYPFKIINDYEN